MKVKINIENIFFFNMYFQYYMNLPENNIDLIKKEQLKYLPCIRLIELYDKCIKIKEKNCNYQKDKFNYQKDKFNYQKDKCDYLLISAVMKCGIS